MGIKTLYLLRGVSGCGKTTLAKMLEVSLDNAVALAADDYFYIGGDYIFDTAKLKKAHQWCRDQVTGYMSDTSWQKDNIIIHNTNTSEKEIQPFYELAEHFGYIVVSLVVENRHNGCNAHSVPEQTLQKQERRLRNSLKLT